MSVLLDAVCSETKPRLCTTHNNNHLEIKQSIIGFLSGIVPVGLQHAPYPGTGESENKITSAYDEALKTVGYGRLEKPCTIYYNNPFDPRLTFDGLGHLLADANKEANCLTKEQLTQNVFLALENSDLVMNDYLNQSRNLYQSLCNSDELDIHVDPNRYKLFPEIDGNVSDDGSEDCKRMFNKIASLPIKNIWMSTQKTTETDTCSIYRKSDALVQATEVIDTVKAECHLGAGLNPPKTVDVHGEDLPRISKIRYSYRKLEGKNKRGVEPAQKSPTESEVPTYERIERDIEQVVSEESEAEDQGKIADSKDTPIQMMTGDPNDEVLTVKLDETLSSPICPSHVSQEEEDVMEIEPTLPIDNSGNGQMDVTAESRHGRCRVSPDQCHNDDIPVTTTTETGPVHDDAVAAKIREFKEGMERLIARTDVPKFNNTSGAPKMTQNCTPLQAEVANAVFAVDSIVAKSVLRPSVPSFYPGFNKGGTAEHGNENIIDGKTQAPANTGNNRVVHPPLATNQLHTCGDNTGGNGVQGQLNWGNIPAMPKTQTVGHMTAGNFQTHNAARVREDTQKPFDFRPTLANPLPCNQPPGVNKIQMQPTQAAAAALFVANCLHQSSRREVTCNPPLPPPPNKTYTDLQPPPRFQQYQQQCGHHGIQNPHAARNPPPGFNDASQAPIRNRDPPNVLYRSEQVHQQHPLPIHQQLPFRFSAEQSFQHQPQQHVIGSRFPHLPVQNVHQQVQQQHHIQQQQFQQQQQQHIQQHQQQQNQNHPQQHPQNHRPQVQQQLQPHQQPHHTHPPLHPLQPQQHFLNPEVPPFQYFNKIQNGSQQTNANVHTSWQLNIQGENTNCNNGNVDLGEESSTPLIKYSTSRLTDDTIQIDTVEEDPGVKADAWSTDGAADGVRMKRLSVSAECIPSLVKGDCNRDKEKHRISKFRSRRTNLVRIYPSKDCS